MNELAVTLTVAQLRELVREAVREELANGRPESDWLDTHGAAKVLGIHFEQVSRLARRKAIPASRLGREWRFRRSELDEYLERQIRKVG